MPVWHRDNSFFSRLWPYEDYDAQLMADNYKATTSECVGDIHLQLNVQLPEKRISWTVLAGRSLDLTITAGNGAVLIARSVIAQHFPSFFVSFGLIDKCTL